MEYFLRFTDTEYEDLKRGKSFFKNTRKALAGLCGFRVADTDEEFEALDRQEEIEKCQRNFGYSAPPVFFSGKIVSRGPIEGDLFTPFEIV